jgi:predicted RNA-binding protein YlqC (UPF0109 family)/Tfp pilus assembly protein PilZ
MNQVREQRQYPRRAALIVAKYTVMEGTFQDIIGNIGAGGLFIKTKRRIAVGQPILTDFPLLELKNTIQVPGRVVRIDTNGFAVTFTEVVAGLVHKEGHFPEIIGEESPMKELLALVTKHMVDYPEQVKVKETDGVNMLVLELSAAKQDIGKVIGKKGRNIGAIRTVMNAASVKIQKRIIVEVLE